MDFEYDLRNEREYERCKRKIMNWWGNIYICDGNICKLKNKDNMKNEISEHRNSTVYIFEIYDEIEISFKYRKKR